VNEPANATPRTSEVTVRVRYQETDQMGVAWHGHYLAWFEMGRTEWMRAAGCAYGEVEDRAGIFFPVVRCGARFRASARYDERLNIRTQLARLGGVKVRFEYEVLRAGANAPLATGFTEHGAVDRAGKPCRIPQALRGLLEDHERSTC